MNLIEARERETKLFAELQAVLDGAEGRQLTPDECEKVEKMNREADEVQARIRSAQSVEAAEMRLGSARGGWDMQNTKATKTAETDFRGFARGDYGREFRALPIAGADSASTSDLGMYSQFIEIMGRLSPMRQICAVDSFSTSDIRYPVQGSQILVDDDTAEGTAYDEFEPTFDSKTPTPRKFAVRTNVTNEAIADSAFDLEGIITSQQAEALAYAQDQCFLMGTGVQLNQNDILFKDWSANSAGGQLKTAQSETTLTIKEMVQGLCQLAPTGYFGRPGAFVVASGLIDDLLGEEADGRPILQAQASSTFSVQSPFQVFGRPVYVTSGGPAMTTGNFCAAYVAQGAARIGDVGGVQFLRDPYSLSINGQVQLVTSVRSSFAVTEPRGIVTYQLN